MRTKDITALATSTLASLLRFGSGGRVAGKGARPERRLILYEMEGCPYSRKVREALSTLDLDADVRPCPKGGARYRTELREEVHAEETVPVLVDPDRAEVIQDSDAIVAYLFEHYGDGRVPLALRLGPLTTLTSKLASALRRGRGARKRAARETPHLELELWSYEASPGCRLVREAMDELEIPYVVHNAARGSQNRDELRMRAGSVTLPWLEDPTTGARVGGYRAVLAYLEQSYAA